MESILNGSLLKKMLISASNELSANKIYVDSLNVFPVPDGDTGTNMSLTLVAAAVEIEKVTDISVSTIAKAAASGSLRGARGNSGVILSQLFRGFARGLVGLETATQEDIARALKNGADTAYKAVMKPKEGTVLTIAREAYIKAFELLNSKLTLDEFFIEIINHCNKVLIQTTDMLLQLKQAGVVDAGGKGLLLIFEGAFKAMGSDTHIDFNLSEASNTYDYEMSSFTSDETITFGYCTEFFINITSGAELVVEPLKQYLSTIGDSVVVVADEDIIKVHVHSDHPGLVIEKALTYGSLSSMKIDNMREQHNNISTPSKELGFVAVALGEGFKELFLSLGVDIVIEGGQTMNPSTEDILNAVNNTNAKNVIILPNNKNIILAAQQVSYLDSNKKIHVIPTKSIPQGITAMIGYDASADVDKNLEMMNESILKVRTARVTYAVRDTTVDNIKISKGDFIGMIEGDIAIVNTDLNKTVFELIDRLADSEHEIISIYYGCDVLESDASIIVDYVNEKHGEFEVELHNGRQPLYYYIIAVE